LWLIAGSANMVISLASGPMGQARNLFGQEVVAPRWRSASAATGGMGNLFGWASLTMLGGYLVPLLGFGGVFYLSAAMVSASGLLMLGYTRRTAPRPQLVTPLTVPVGMSSQPPEDCAPC
jgi:hypothetical protein